MSASSSSGGGRRVFRSYKDALVLSAFAEKSLLIQFDIPAFIKLTLVILTKLAVAILDGWLFGGYVPPAQYCPSGRERQVLVCCILLKNSCQIRQNAYVRIILSDFVCFWCIFCMAFFRRRVRIAGGRFWCTACNPVNQTCSTSTLLVDNC